MRRRPGFDQNINAAFVKLASQQFQGWSRDAEFDPRIASPQLPDDCGHEAWREPETASDPHLSNLQVGKGLDVLSRQPQIVEDGRSTIEQGSAVERGLDALGAALKQADAHGALQFPDRFGDGRLSRIEEGGCLVHAAGLHHRDQDVEVAQLDALADAVAETHGTLSYCRINITL